MAIARFDNLSRDPVDEWIGEGISETLATALGPVVPPGARWRVVGAYQRVGDTLRITARLVDPTTDRPVAVFTIDGPVADLFGLQDELGTRLITAVGEATPALPPSRVPRRVEPTAGTAEFRMPAFTGLHGPPPPVAPEVVTRDASGRVTMRAIRLDAPLELDGQLDERVYVDVDPVTGLIQQEPEEGALATDQTEVWVTFDADTLYISARCWSEEPERIVANAMNRDSFSMYGNETISVVLDTFYDRRNAFGFTTNAVGGLFDSLITDERSQNVDWNTVWDVKVGRFDQGWTVEMAIPFKSLRYRAGGAQIWGVNVQRRVASKNEVSFITPIPASLAWQGLYQMSSAATLTGLEVPDSGSRFEMKPYAISDLSTDLNAAPTVRNNLAGDVGFDAKFGVTSGLTADVTYNTDFAQVEVDEQQVNLTRFSLFFPEKREFFLEGKGIFDFAGGRQGGGPTTFYFGGGQFSGTAPILFFSRRIGLQDGRTVPIRAGGRLTGKAGPYSIGVLNVQTGDELVSGATATNFSVARIKRDVLRRSAVGAMFAGRSVTLGGKGSNQTFGVDGVFSFFDNVRVTSYLARTQTPGVSGDDTSYQAQFEYGGDRWGLVLDRLAVGDNFNPEMGFIRRDDFRRNFAELRFSPRPQGLPSVRKFLFQGSVDYTTDGTNRLETRLQQGIAGIEFESGDYLFAGVTDNFELLDRPFEITPDIVIPVGGYHFMNTRVVYAFGQQRMVSGGLSFDHGGFFDGDRTGVGYTFGRVSLSPRLSVEPSVSLNRISGPQGDFSTKLVSARTTYTMTPRMFAAALVQYNSTLDSLGTNLRFRWEYQPGSELFVVYTDERNTLDFRSPALQNRALVVKVTRLLRF